MLVGDLRMSTLLVRWGADVNQRILHPRENVFETALYFLSYDSAKLFVQAGVNNGVARESFHRQAVAGRFRSIDEFMQSDVNTDGIIKLNLFREIMNDLSNPLRLQCLCRIAIRRQVSDVRWDLQRLPLPLSLIKFLTFEM